MSWFDTHCHPYMAEGDPIEQIERARDQGVSEMVVVGVDLASSMKAVELASLEEGVYAAIGLHPNSASDLDDALLDELRDLASAPGVVGIGETGLDFYRQGAPAEVQEEAFRAQIALARECGLALVIHTRDASDATKRVLGEETLPDRFVMHCFSGDEKDGRDYLAMGAYLSFAGPVTFSNAQSLRDAAAALPLERMVVETDSPFLSPHPFRGKANEPARVGITGAAIADLKGMPVSEVEEVTRANARQLFGLTG